MIVFRIGPPIEEPRGEKDAQELTEEENESDRFVTLAGIKNADQQNRQTDLEAKHREHVSPYGAEWPKRDLPALQCR